MLVEAAHSQIEMMKLLSAMFSNWVAEQPGSVSMPCGNYGLKLHEISQNRTGEFPAVRPVGVCICIGLLVFNTTVLDWCAHTHKFPLLPHTRCFSLNLTISCDMLEDRESEDLCD